MKIIEVSNKPLIKSNYVTPFNIQLTKDQQPITIADRYRTSRLQISFNANFIISTEQIVYRFSKSGFSILKGTVTNDKDVRKLQSRIHK